MEDPRHEPRHPIAVVADRTGLSQDVLRVWERRYSAVAPRRSTGGQRLYSDADIERLRLMHAVSRAGRSISQIAGMSTDALSALAEEDAAARPSLPAAAERSDAGDIVQTSLTLVRALEASRLADELRRAATSRGLPSFIDVVAAPFMRRIGEEWHAGSLTIAQEHLATAVLRDLLVGMMRGFASRPGAERMIVATPSGERHEIGAAIVGASAAADGWNVVYLGGDLPSTEIVEAARASGARIVALSIVYAEDRSRVLDEVGRIRSALSRDVRVVAGGAGAREMSDSLVAMGIEVVERIERPGLR